MAKKRSVKPPNREEVWEGIERRAKRDSIVRAALWLGVGFLIGWLIGFFLFI